jgi:actin-like ATPase involved in cell morphogenesis
MPFSLGVDIGSTYTAAALWRDGSVQSVPLGNRSNAVPSVLFLREDGTLLVGEAASRRAVVEPDRQARDFKRRMGDEVPVLLGDDHRMPAHELTGHLLRWVLDTASEREGERPGHLVLTHPAEWGDYRRDLLVEAAATAGLPDVGLLPEPVAAAAWYAAQDRIAPGALVGVYDLGGGTFDASVVRKTETGFEVFGEPGGDETIGGLNFDHTLLRYVAAAAGVDLAALDDTDPAIAAGLAQFRDAVVDAKEALSADTEATIPVLLPGLARHVTIGRTQLESLIRPQILSTVQLFAQIVARAGAQPDALHGVLLVGGSSRIPLVSQLLRSELGARVAVDAHPKYAVSLGAAITSAPHVALPVGPRVVAPFTPPVVPPFTPPVVPPVVPGWAGPTMDVPTVPATDATAELRPVAPAPEAGGGAPTVVHPVNLAATGLTTPTDVTIAIAPRRFDIPRPRVTDRDEPVVVRTGAAGSGYWGRGLLTAAVVVAVIAAAVVGIAALVARSPDQPRVQSTQASGATGGPTAKLPTVEATGQLVTDPAGSDAMRAVTALPSGDLVAVGHSVNLLPRAWLRHGGAWRPVALPGTGAAALSDVAVAGGRLVAVGWTGANNAKHPAVWTSANGEAWSAVAPSPDLKADGLIELTAVVAAPGGGFLAAGVDHKADKDGDVALFRSADGAQWQRAKADGLDGPGSQQVQRIAAVPGGYVAVGAALSGARLGPAVWTSADGLHWQPAATRPSGSPTLWAVLRQADGSLLSCGSAGSVDSPAAGCWVQRGTDWQPLAVQGSPTALYIYGLVPTGGGVVAVGVGRDGTAVDAASWTLRLPS